MTTGTGSGAPRNIKFHARGPSRKHKALDLPNGTRRRLTGREFPPRPTSFHESPMDPKGLIYDWNDAGEQWQKPAFRIQFDDETLRDGLQSPSVRSPLIEQKVAILHLMDRLGIDTA